MLKPRIVLVDDHRILLDAIKGIIEPEFEVIGIFEDARIALEKCPDLRPDVVVLDVGMPGMNGISAAEEFKHILPKTKLVFLTMNRDMDIAAEAFQLGASGYVLKTAAASELVHCIRDVLRGGFYASPVLTEGMVGSFVQAFKKRKSSYNLTPRQRAVLQLLAEGQSMKQVAIKLNITPRTVAFHKYTIMEQNNIKSNAELLAFAASHLPAAS